MSVFSIPDRGECCCCEDLPASSQCQSPGQTGATQGWTREPAPGVLVWLGCLIELLGACCIPCVCFCASLEGMPSDYACQISRCQLETNIHTLDKSPPSNIVASANIARTATATSTNNTSTTPRVSVETHACRAHRTTYRAH